ncbi:MAG: twin-arginine translocase subunit TatC [Kiloniellales bacterium]|nr:twin-arginine translocase subunit TatC [Kiloniellales bacterium]
MTTTTDDDGTGGRMPLLEHLVELRSRLLKCVVALIVAFLICFYFADEIFEFLAEPLLRIMEARGLAPTMIITALTEGFFTEVKVAFFAAAFLTCPVFLTQFWLFVAPGLYRHEKKAMLPFLVATPFLFFIGGALVYYIIFPTAADFLLSVVDIGVPKETGELEIELQAKISEYLSLMMKLIFAFGICFQLPVVMTLLARTGLATSKGMAEKRKYAIVGVFVVAAIFTPPDPISQLMLAVPIIILYEVSIYMAKIVEKKRAEQEDDADDADEDATSPSN